MKEGKQAGIKASEKESQEVPIRVKVCVSVLLKLLNPKPTAVIFRVSRNTVTSDVMHCSRCLAGSPRLNCSKYIYTEGTNYQHILFHHLPSFQKKIY